MAMISSTVREVQDHLGRLVLGVFSSAQAALQRCNRPLCTWRNDGEIKKVELLDFCVGMPPKRLTLLSLFHYTTLVSLFGLRPPNADGRPVLGSDDVLGTADFNIS